MDQLWEIINSPLVSVLWKFSSLGYLIAAGMAIWYLRRHLKQNDLVLQAIQDTQSDIRVLMESRTDHSSRITRLEDSVLFETGHRNRRKP